MGWKKTIRKIGGILLFVFGIAALAIPIIPGWALIALGIYLVSLDSPATRARVLVIRQRFVWVDAALRRFDRQPNAAEAEK